MPACDKTNDLGSGPSIDSDKHGHLINQFSLGTQLVSKDLSFNQCRHFKESDQSWQMPRRPGRSESSLDAKPELLIFSSAPHLVDNHLPIFHRFPFYFGNRLAWIWFTIFANFCCGKITIIIVIS